MHGLFCDCDKDYSDTSPCNHHIVNSALPCLRIHFISFPCSPHYDLVVRNQSMRYLRWKKDLRCHICHTPKAMRAKTVSDAKFCTLEFVDSERQYQAA